MTASTSFSGWVRVSGLGLRVWVCTRDAVTTLAFCSLFLTGVSAIAGPVKASKQRRGAAVTETETEKERESERETAANTAHPCVCVCVCVCARAYVCVLM